MDQGEDGARVEVQFVPLRSEDGWGFLAAAAAAGRRRLIVADAVAGVGSPGASACDADVVFLRPPALEAILQIFQG